MPRFTPTNATARAAPGSAPSMGRLRSPVTKWWPPWMPSASTARCWFPRSACIATTPPTPKRSTPRIQPVQAGQAGRSDRPRGTRYDRRLGGHQGNGRHPGLPERQRFDRPRHQPYPGHGGAALATGQPGVYRPPGQGAPAGSAKPQYAAGDRPPWPVATARAATAREAIRRSAKAARPGRPR